MDICRDRRCQVQHGADHNLHPVTAMYGLDHSDGVPRDKSLGECHQPGAHFDNHYLLPEPVLLQRRGEFGSAFAPTFCHSLMTYFCRLN